MIFVADYADILPRARQQAHQLFLRAIRVLKFVHHQILELRAPCRAHVGMVAQQLHRAQKQIVEIERRRFAQDFVVGAKNLGGVLAARIAHLAGLGFHFVRT